MKGAYIAKRDTNLEKTKGVSNKIFGQVKAFEKLGINMDLFHIQDVSIVENDLPLKQIKRGVLHTISRNHTFYTTIYNSIKSKKYNFIYIRHPMTTLSFLRFLSKIKNNDLKIILEIPTYPYKGEADTLKKSIIINIDTFFNRYLKKKINRIVTFYDQKEIFGIPTIQLANGIDVSSIDLIERSKSLANEIKLIGVANVKFFHAYDRIIKGISDNITNYNIIFNLVGQGPEIGKLKKLAQRLNVEDKIIFYGFKSGKELDEIFRDSDIGVGTLGMHRKNLTTDSSLKTREYCARGMSFISSCYDKDFGDDFQYQLLIPGDDSPLNVENLVVFFKRIQNLDYKNEMRQYAYEKLDWSVKLKEVVNFVEKGKSNER